MILENQPVTERGICKPERKCPYASNYYHVSVLTKTTLSPQASVGSLRCQGRGEKGSPSPNPRQYHVQLRQRHLTHSLEMSITWRDGMSSCRCSVIISICQVCGFLPCNHRSQKFIYRTDLADLTTRNGLKKIHRDFDAIYRRLDRLYDKNSTNEKIVGGVVGIYAKMCADSILRDKLFKAGLWASSCFVTTLRSTHGQVF